MNKSRVADVRDAFTTAFLACLLIAFVFFALNYPLARGVAALAVITFCGALVSRFVPTEPSLVLGAFVAAVKAALLAALVPVIVVVVAIGYVAPGLGVPSRSAVVAFFLTSFILTFFGVFVWRLRRR